MFVFSHTTIHVGSTWNSDSEIMYSIYAPHRSRPMRSALNPDQTACMLRMNKRMKLDKVFSEQSRVFDFMAFRVTS